MNSDDPKLPESGEFPPATFSEAIRRHMAAHAGFYGICLLLGAQAFFTGFYDNFWIIDPPEWGRLGWWQKVAALFKSLSFAIGIAVGYALKPATPPKS